MSFRRSEPKPKEMVEQYNRKEPWILWLGAALALHALLLVLIPQLPAPQSPSPRVEVTQIDPSQLESLKRQWKEKALLLSKNPEAPKDTTPPPENARYSSDRNRTVERETRAEQTDVLPQPGRPGAPGTQDTPEAERPSRKLPPLSQLGVALPGSKADQAREARKKPEKRGGPSGQAAADQAIPDRNLPLGGENLLNTEESRFHSYYSRLYEAVAPIWKSYVQEVPQRQALRKGDYITSAEVFFDREGNLAEVVIIESSGIPEFDQAVRASWSRVKRAPNPPKDLLGPRGRIRTGWTFTVQIGTGAPINLAPQRVY